MRTLMALLGLLILAGCSAPTFRTPPLSKQQALARTEVLEMRVVKVISAVGDALDHDRETGVSHYIEVDVLSGTSAGKQLTIPLDDWRVQPPVEGTVVYAAPADWLKGTKNGPTRPFGGW